MGERGMWWDALVPKNLVEERLREADQYRQRLEAMESTLGWKLLVAGRARLAKWFPPDGRLSFVPGVCKKAAQIYLRHGLRFALWRVLSYPVRASWRRWRHRHANAGMGPPAVVDAPLVSAPAVDAPAGSEVPMMPEPAPVHLAIDSYFPKPLAPVPRTGPRFRVYTNSQGNYFFHEMRDLVVAGLTELGYTATAADETEGFGSGGDDWHIIIAPHEFFYIGTTGWSLAEGQLPANLVLVNTEQSCTQWYQLASRFFPRAHTIWDIDYTSSQRLWCQGLRGGYLPLGYLANFPLYQAVAELPVHYGTKHLAPEIRNRSTLADPLVSRPIDVVFFGNTTAKREQFFAQAAPILAKYHCYLHFSNTAKPLLAGKTTYMDTPTVLGLVQRSKILVNIHRAEDRYFEWHRIVMLGIWQRILVVSEPCTPAPPFRPGIDYIETELSDIPKRVDYYLSSAKGRREAQAIASEGYRTLTHNCQFTDILRPLVDQLFGIRPFQFRPPLFEEAVERAVA
jgi:hypothetical protein